MCSIGFISQSILLPNWFIKRRGLAIGVAMAGIGVGIQVLVPFTQYIISRFGWRSAYCFLAAIMMGVVLPLNAVFQRKNPEEFGELPDGKKVATEHKPFPKQNDGSVIEYVRVQWTLGRSLKTKQFWFLFLTFFFVPMAVQGTMVHQVAHVVDKGFSAERGAFFFGLTGIIGSVGKIIFGYLSDKIGQERSLAIGISCAFLGILCLMNIQPGHDRLLYGYAIFFGLGYGSIAPIFPSRAADLFQGSHFGKIYGFLSISFGLGGAVGAWMNGKIFDLTSSYHIAFLCILAALVLVVIFFWFTTASSINEQSFDSSCRGVASSKEDGTGSP